MAKAQLRQLLSPAEHLLLLVPITALSSKGAGFILEPQPGCRDKSAQMLYSQVLTVPSGKRTEEDINQGTFQSIPGNVEVADTGKRGIYCYRLQTVSDDNLSIRIGGGLWSLCAVPKDLPNSHREGCQVKQRGEPWTTVSRA